MKQAQKKDKEKTEEKTVEKEKSEEKEKTPEEEKTDAAGRINIYILLCSLRMASKVSVKVSRRVGLHRLTWVKTFCY